MNTTIDEKEEPENKRPQKMRRTLRSKKNISRGEFHRILNKASQPIEKPESDREQS